MSLRLSVEDDSTSVAAIERRDTPSIHPHEPVHFRVEVNSAESHGPFLGGFLAGDTVPCFLGLSPDTSFLNRGRLCAILEWLVPKTSRLAIAEGSFLTRWNLRALHGLSEHEAERVAREQHRETAERILQLVSEFWPSRRIELLDWPSIVLTPEFKSVSSRIEEYSGRTPSFERGLDLVVAEFLGRTRERGKLLMPTQAQMKLLRAYVVEEVAMFVHLYRMGLKTEVYPGDDLQLMRQISAGKFNGFPFDLSERTHISIRLRRA